MPRLHRCPRALWGAIVALFLSAAPATAQTYTWTGGGGNALWSTSGNWIKSGGIHPPPPPSQFLVFNNNNQLTITFQNAITGRADCN